VPLHGEGAGAADLRPTFTTLGTFAGQIPSADRSQPANVIRMGDRAILIDAGDGVAGQLAKAKVPLGAVTTVFISHLHYDHTGGLFGLLGLRRRSNATAITIYGPLGTKNLVAGLLAAMQPYNDLVAATRGLSTAPTSDMDIQVVELRGGDRIDVAGARVTAAANTHYTFPPGSKAGEQFQSLSLRFDFPGRSIVYTGDTGPSAAVEQLAKGADLLVSEISDADGLISAQAKAGRPLSGRALQLFDHHMRMEHLTPEEVGRLATRANVKSLVLTHLGLGDRTVEQTRPVVTAHYRGTVTFANDLDTF
jgi:ribonuclease BN (tRNA processing enzyme)